MIEFGSALHVTQYRLSHLFFCVLGNNPRLLGTKYFITLNLYVVDVGVRKIADMAICWPIIPRASPGLAFTKKGLKLYEAIDHAPSPT